MIKNGITYLTYNKYEDRFGNKIRPALVRYEEHSYQEHYYQEPIDYVEYTIYIDGKSYSHNLNGSRDFKGKPYSITLLKPFRSNDKELQDYNLIAQKFHPNQVNDWIVLFADSLHLHNISDPLAYALIVIAFDKFTWDSTIIRNAISSFKEEDRDVLFDMIGYLSWALSPNKIKQIQSLFNLFGKACDACFPPAVEVAAKEFKIFYSDFNVHSLIDEIEEKAANNPEYNSELGLLKLYHWLNDESSTISYQELNDSFPYLDEDTKGLVIKRLFFDIKNGRCQFNEEITRIFSSPNSYYYSTFRYIFESWPDYRNVSSEFVLDCLNTYRLSNQQSFQVYNGILDWAMQKSRQLHRPVDLYFYDWLCYCQGGVILNPKFRGFANFKIKYEIDDFAFDEDSIYNNIKTLRGHHSCQLSHEESREVIDKSTGLPLLDENGEPVVETITVWDDRWKIREATDRDNNMHKQYIDLFVNWARRPESETDECIFTSEMIDSDIVRANVEQYILNKFGTLSPYIYEREKDEVVTSFMYEVAMKAILDDSVELGASPGVEESVVKESVKERLIEIMGESLECEFDPSKLRLAQTDSQYRFNADDTKCFIKSEKTYRKHRKIYCAPTLSDTADPLTKRKCAICQGDKCFVTSIKKAPDWRSYKLIHLLEILGYDILEETEAGFIPNQTYNQFVNQINKAVRFYSRLICRDCGHILFPATRYGHSKYKCLSPICPEYDKEVYLNFCHKCKKGLIDSRDTKKCPNDLYICPECGSCCSNDFFESMADRYRMQGKTIPMHLSSKIGQGHADRFMIFCHKCGTRKVDVHENGEHRPEGRCPLCDPLPPVEQTQDMNNEMRGLE